MSWSDPGTILAPPLSNPAGGPLKRRIILFLVVLAAMLLLKWLTRL
jgi:hypothetical protein